MSRNEKVSSQLEHGKVYLSLLNVDNSTYMTWYKYPEIQQEVGGIKRTVPKYETNIHVIFGILCSNTKNEIYKYVSKKIFSFNFIIKFYKNGKSYEN